MFAFDCRKRATGRMNEIYIPHRAQAAASKRPRLRLCILCRCKRLLLIVLDLAEHRGREGGRGVLGEGNLGRWFPLPMTCGCRSLLACRPWALQSFVDDPSSCCLQHDTAWGECHSPSPSECFVAGVHNRGSPRRNATEAEVMPPTSCQVFPPIHQSQRWLPSGGAFQPGLQASV